MSAKPKISQKARDQLREELVPDVAVDAAEIMLGEIHEAAATVGREYDPDIGDDPNLAGLTVARRGKNLAAKALKEQAQPKIAVRSVKGFTWDINAGGTRLHTYSAPGGLDEFQLVGGERKADIVERSQKQLSLFEAEGEKKQPGDLVLAYVRDRRGLRRAALGVMKSEEEFEWQVAIYNADAEMADVPQEENVERKPSFREQPEKVAEISLKRSKKERESL